ncbi:MAG: DUF3703 domain-containing protein [Xanthomonadales bacterium]|nr:DUF3703 domain-containing protein [Xanthomonadales bacterium]
MNEKLRTAYCNEHAATDAAISRGDFEVAFAHLERAHVLSQRFAFAHTWTHLRMLGVGWRRHDLREVIGQVFRSVAALTKSKIWVPLGNTGGANVNPFKPMPVPPDLRPYLD